MLQGALQSGAAHRKSVFEAFARRLPDGRRYGIVAGTGRLLEGIANFRFGEPELDYLHRTKVVNDQTLDYLAGYSFSGDIWGYPEGEAYFPNSPVLIVESTFGEACILETYLLSVLNHDCAIASAASRMISAAGTRPCIEMGSRRTHEESAVAAARAAVIAGFGPGTSLLVDTYDVESAVRTAVDLAGDKLGAVRLDSGDLIAQAQWVRQLLDELGNVNTRIIVTSDLDEFAIAALQSAPVDSYGVGTSLVTGSGAPTASMVYKLVSRTDESGDFVSVAKAAKNKTSKGGRKYALRKLNERGTASQEIVGIGHRPDDDGNDRQLLQQFIKNGELLPGWTGPEGVVRARQRHADSMRELPAVVNRLQRGEAAIPTIYEED